MSITTHVQAVTTALTAIDYHLGSMLDHGVTPDQYKAIEPDLIALEHTINHHATIAAQTTIRTTVGMATITAVARSRVWLRYGGEGVGEIDAVVGACFG